MGTPVRGTTIGGGAAAAEIPPAGCAQTQIPFAGEVQAAAPPVYAVDTAASGYTCSMLAVISALPGPHHDLVAGICNQIAATSVSGSERACPEGGADAWCAWRTWLPIS